MKSNPKYLEQVVRAIAEAGGSDFDKLPISHGPGFGLRQMYERMAIAAIGVIDDNELPTAEDVKGILRD